MINRLTIFIVTIVYLLFIPFGVSAEQCSAIFPGGAQNNSSSGSISFGYHSRITNLPDNILHTRELIDASGGTSCDTVACIQGNVIADVIDYNDFPNNNNDIDLINGATATITPGAYNDIRLDTGAILTLSAGDYKIGGKLQLRNSSQIVLSGSGVVRIFVEEYIEINSSSLINNNGDALQLLVYGKTDILLGSNAIINGFIYSKKDVQLNYKSVLNGAVNGKNVTLISESTINFVPETPDFGLICSGPVQLLADYHFDECSYTGVAFEVIDETGDFPASTFGGLNTTDVGQVERAADLNVANHHIETSIPLPSTYSISTWFKKTDSDQWQSIFYFRFDGCRW